MIRQIKNKIANDILKEIEIQYKEKDLKETSPWEVDLKGADMKGVNLWGEALSEADLREANLWEVDLKGADMKGVNL